MNPLLFSLLLNRARGQDPQTAARNAIIGRVVNNAVAGVGNPVARAVVSAELSSRIKTGQPATEEAVRNAAVGAAIRNIASPSRDTYDT